MQRIACPGFHADDCCGGTIPTGDTANQSATTYGHQNRVKVWSLLLKLEPKCCLANNGAFGVIGMDVHGACLFNMVLAQDERFLVVGALLDNCCAIASNAAHFCR